MRRRRRPPGPSEAALGAAWAARRCAACAGADVIAVLLPLDAGAGDISLCVAHFQARMANPVLARIGALRCE